MIGKLQRKFAKITTLRWQHFRTGVMNVLVILIIGMQLFVTVVKGHTLMKTFGKSFFVIEANNIELDN